MDLRKLEYLTEIKSLAVVIILGFVIMKKNIILSKFCGKCRYHYLRSFTDKIVCFMPRGTQQNYTGRLRSDPYSFIYHF